MTAEEAHAAAPEETPVEQQETTAAPQAEAAEAEAPKGDDKALEKVMATEAEEERHAGAWDEVPGRSSVGPLLVAGLSLMGLVTALVFCFLAEYNNDFIRADQFHPTRVALQSRHWSMYTKQFLPVGPVYWVKDTTELVEDARRAACIVYETKQGHYHFPQAFSGSAGIQAFNEVFQNEVATLGKKGDMECSFEVPYTAVWGGMAVSFLGFAAVAMHTRMVLAMPRGTTAMSELADTIHSAAMEFLHQEYTWLAPFVLLLWVFLFVAIDGQENDWVPASSVSFLFGAALSAGCGYFGMHIATEGNTRTAAACYSDREAGAALGLQVAFRTGACMGLGVVCCGLFGLTLSYAIFGNVEALGGFGFGSSAVALFARVGGGIYTKAADVGADLCGKVDKDLGEDSPKNPATIADCVGDNVGDVAGMGADLFESFVGAIVAAAVLGAPEFGKKGVALPFYIALIGLFISIICTITVRVKVAPGQVPSLTDLLCAMRINVMVAGVLITVCSLFLCIFLFESEREHLKDLESWDVKLPSYLPSDPAASFETQKELRSVPFDQENPGARLFGCIVVGLAVGILIGMVTEYFTSHTEEPTQSIGRSTEYGPGPVIIQGLGMGMYSTVVPLLLIVAAVLGAYYLCGFYGTAIACVGMLSTLGVTMSTDAYGPVSDNAGGIAEMSELPSWVRDYTDALDALGNTTAATGKGFANGSAVLSALSIMTAFARVADIEQVDLLRPVVVIGVLVGSLLPYVFGAMTMLSVNKAAQEMMAEVRRQFKENPSILTDPNSKPDYARCIQISCTSSLKEMLLPGVLAIFSPLVMGFIFGSHCLVGLLVGAIASGYLLGVMMSNTGGAWDNAKKWIEAGEFSLDGEVQGKKTDCHKAAVCGDTVGDPFKDTSGPALNILIKLMTRFAFVCAPLFDDAWDFWWVGLILLGVALVCVAVVVLVVPRLGNSEAPASATEPAEAA